jgi:hypothetical protein
MMLTLHTLAETYKVLPSEALARASTFDLYVLDLNSKYQRHQEAKQQGKAPNAGSNLSQQQMKDMLIRAKNFKPKERK